MKPQHRIIFALPVTLGALLLASAAGCASWKKSDESPSEFLPKPKQSLDSVLVTTVLVRFPYRKLEKLQEIWNSTDESIFDIELRERLAMNGLRAGRFIGDLPSIIREQIDETAAQQNSDALEHAGLAADVDNRMRQLQCRAGRRKDLLVRREVNEPLTVLTSKDGKVSGETFDNPAVLFDLRAIPHGDGQATIELVPEVQYGAHRQSYVASEFGVRPEMRRSQRVWRELKMSAKLRPGEILAIASVHPPKALGSVFFTTQTADQTQEYVVLLIRVGETQLDELFAPEDVEQAQTMAER